MSAWRDSDIRRLTTAKGNAEKAEAAIRAQVKVLRLHGCPWSVIGDALGVTRQAAQQRYGS